MNTHARSTDPSHVEISRTSRSIQSRWDDREALARQMQAMERQAQLCRMLFGSRPQKKNRLSMSA